VEKPGSAWNVWTLKEYVDQRFIDEEKAVRAALAAAEKAVEKAEANAEKWRANANEWRAAMQDREVKFAQKSEVEGRLSVLDKSYAEVRNLLSVGGGAQQGTKAVKDESRANMAVIIAIGSLVVGFLIASLAILNAIRK
jgi:hypothetical protein